MSKSEPPVSNGPSALTIFVAVLLANLITAFLVFNVYAPIYVKMK